MARTAPCPAVLPSVRASFKDPCCLGLLLHLGGVAGAQAGHGGGGGGESLPTWLYIKMPQTADV
jgi:hypothetical protein